MKFFLVSDVAESRQLTWPLIIAGAGIASLYGIFRITKVYINYSH
jgi:hypothetical protein